MFGRSLFSVGAAGVHRRAAQLGIGALAVAGFGLVGGCLTRPIDPQGPRSTSTVLEQIRQSSVDKIDLLFVVDNSASMGDKQTILSLAISDLLGGLLNPQCVDAMSKPVMRPAGPLDACPMGTQREFPPVLDVHVGVLTSSLGTPGTNGCSTVGNPTNDDQGHLITRSDPANPTTSTVATYQNLGFLAFDPAQKMSPPGIADLASLGKSLGSIVTGAGQIGCGYESQDEAWYRFLVDPAPYGSIPLGLPVVVQGVDSQVLDQRKAFLRPDSLLAIINVTDETDTSVKAYSGYPKITDGTPLPPSRSECWTKGPADHCCSSCGLPTPSGCPTDPMCMTSSVDNSNIHAFGLVSHKQSYGIDFFYPTSRYVNALTSKTITDENGKSAPNPIYSNLDPSNKNATVRDSGLVFYAAITGVPWQLIARKTNGQPDLSAGFMSSKELTDMQAGGHSYWDIIAGDPDNYVAPISPFMQESAEQRMGTDPITGIAMTVAPTVNPINGYERPIAPPKLPGAGDIQYACSFPILTPLDCTQVHCPDCAPQRDSQTNQIDYTLTDKINSENPLCAQNPSDGMHWTQQKLAKAYPGVRNLAIARGLGDQGIAASICAKTLDPADINSPEYGYRPAVQAIIDRLKTAIGGQCLPRALTPDGSGQVPCLVLEARDTGGAPCTCTGTARSPVSADHQPAVQQLQAQESFAANECFCEITQTTGAALTSCENDAIASNADGWCYVDATHGNPQLVSRCPTSEQHQIRFVGAGQAANGASTYIICASD